eukprot:m.181184 g.181184  ORF g.181184 m.181184 type:complete len:91 (+) comp21479_c0_seq2:591-863(+)
MDSHQVQAGQSLGVGLESVWMLLRCGMDVVLWYYIVAYSLWPPRSFLQGSLFPMLFILLGQFILSWYLNPYWLFLKFRQIARRNTKYKAA